MLIDNRELRRAILKIRGLHSCGKEYVSKQGLFDLIKELSMETPELRRQTLRKADLWDRAAWYLTQAQIKDILAQAEKEPHDILP